ncbi:MAG: 50S ribosomal protein L15 [Deltaproteobacteria bacterium]|nr:50S ribosomal protein L15 [Deltaproteobacteria bacterium]
MNELSNLRPVEGSRKARKRVGRGIGSGTGKTAGRGQKGQKARAASKKKVGFEGGQMPIYRRLPARGFRPFDKTEWSIVNIVDLNEFDAGTAVTPELLAEWGFIRKPTDLVKILGDGELTKSLSVRAHKFSKTAEGKITAQGGSVEVIGG